MNLFQSVLAELSKKIHSASLYKKDIAETLSTLLAVPINEDQVIVKGTAVYIHVSPTIRTALVLKKKAVLEGLKKYNITLIG